MIQDIAPSKLNNSYSARRMQEGDLLLHFDPEGRVLVREKEGKISFPKTEAADCGGENVYLFSIDETYLYLSPDPALREKEGFGYRPLRELRRTCIGKEVFAAYTAYHLWKWYTDHRFCGKCAAPLVRSDKERALVCPTCGGTFYPRINPAVIVGVRKGEHLLITRYRTGYQHNALVAGFTEIGETLEETVAREVMEETGVKVRNICYYKSQPWGIAQDILVGFYCDAEEGSEIRMDENELKYAEWVKREDIVLQPDDISLTNEMMRRFKEGGD